MVMTIPPENIDRQIANQSPFRNDDRCEDVMYFVGFHYEEVYTETFAWYHAEKAIDYDVFKDNVSGNWIGVVCKDV